MVLPDRRQAENAEIRRLLRNIPGNHGYGDLSIENSIEAFATCGLLQEVSDVEWASLPNGDGAKKNWNHSATDRYEMVVYLRRYADARWRCQAHTF